MFVACLKLSQYALSIRHSFSDSQIYTLSFLTLLGERYIMLFHDVATSRESENLHTIIIRRIAIITNILACYPQDVN